MKNNNIVDSETFFKMIVDEIKNKNTGRNQYIFSRFDNELWFYGYATDYFVSTNIIDENQFRDYYERLQDTFGNEFREFLEIGVHGGDNTLNAMINNKIITVKGNYENETWIDDKLAGKYTQKRKQIKL
jgi:hypothetical protein